jgi:putative salt-induced outer membrane protein
MKKSSLATLFLVAAACGAHAQTTSPPASASDNNGAANGGWTGSGEFGFASSRGNSRSENSNAKLGLNQENEYWKNAFYLNGLRSKGDVDVVDSNTGATVDKFSTTANRYDSGASVGYKLDPRSYVVGAARYEHDDFGANIWQAIVSIGYGYIALKNERTELSFEIGPGYKQYQPTRTTEDLDGDGVAETTFMPERKREVVARGLINAKYRLTDNTSLEDTFLTESGSQNKYYQNDLGLSVSMTKKLALKIAYQLRYNSDTTPGTQSTDQLYTTNLVYNF